VGGFFENEDYNFGTIKGRDFLDHLSDCLLLMNGREKLINCFNNSVITILNTCPNLSL